jgi:hypothetical protein
MHARKTINSRSDFYEQKYTELINLQYAAENRKPITQIDTGKFTLETPKGKTSKQVFLYIQPTEKKFWKFYYSN